MTNRFTKTSFFVQGGIMGVPFDGTPKNAMFFQVVNAQNENSNLRKKLSELENQVQNANKVIQQNQETIDELLANQANVDNVKNKLLQFHEIFRIYLEIPICVFVVFS